MKIALLETGIQASICAEALANLLVFYATQQVDSVETVDIFVEASAIRVVLVGEKACAHLRLTCEIMADEDPSTGLTPMQRITTSALAVLTQWLLDGRIKTPGVLPLEQAVSARSFLEALAQYNIRLRMDMVPLQETHLHH